MGNRRSGSCVLTTRASNNTGSHALLNPIGEYVVLTHTCRICGPDRTLFSPRNYTNATCCSFNPKEQFARRCHDNKCHNRNKLSQYIVVRSELTGTGTLDAAYPLPAPGLGSKVRGICFYAVTAAIAIFLFVLLLVVHPFVLLFDRYRRKVHHLIAKIWALATVTPFLKVEVEGLENLPAPNTPAVYVSNHQSFLDIYTLLTLGRSFKFISKTSIFIFPVVGWAMFLMGLIPLRRMDSRSQLKGAFSIAAKTKVPVVPITIIGTGKIMPSGRERILNPGSVRIVIHKPIEGNNADMLCNEARNVIADVLVGES
ncbi:phospholipid/glycerol acyltransferase family protein [Actinidia rufa]|uniref:Phospholipid/glycerol acyltransferase family protein n=1 Tax=Actinidia rufa TaxID=165716 RepID=A0A7J0EGW3_9ERIC|nr:phospholipid/glycerol acyltransferase family protein [Actinidia rufa]